MPCTCPVATQSYCLRLNLTCKLRHKNQLLQTKPTAVEMKAYAMAGLKRLFDRGKCILVAKDAHRALTRCPFPANTFPVSGKHLISADLVHLRRDSAVALAHRMPHQVIMCKRLGCDSPRNCLTAGPVDRTSALQRLEVAEQDFSRDMGR